MIDRDKVTELLKNYRSYKYAVRMYEQSIGVPCATTAVYDDMPRSSSFGSRSPRMNDGISVQDTLDYLELKQVVEAIDGAVQYVLSDDEQMVIKRKYLDQNTTTLYRISVAKDKDESTIRRWHKEALRKLATSLEMITKPSMYEIPEKNIQNARFMHASA